MYDPTTPSVATRPSFFFAEARPRLRRISIARSSLPSASTRAFLHSIMPAPVFSLSDFTAAAVISAMIADVLPDPIEKRSPAEIRFRGCARRILVSSLTLSLVGGDHGLRAFSFGLVG